MTAPRILAYIAIRDEAQYLATVLSHLSANGVGVVMLDNGADPPLRAALEGYLREGLLEAIVDLPWTGTFNLSEQLEAKARLSERFESDWVLHLDSDELPQSAQEGETLAGAIARADAAGFNAINFEEFVFLPVAPATEANGAGFFPHRHYYMFAPRPQRLMRAWRRDSGLSNLAAGGHELNGENLRLFPENQVLRHYPFLSQEHAYEKYARRRFHPSELARGWHCNRVNIERERFRFPPVEQLQRLDRVDQHAMDRSQPYAKHYWEWPETCE